MSVSESEVTAINADLIAPVTGIPLPSDGRTGIHGGFRGSLDVIRGTEHSIRPIDATTVI